MATTAATRPPRTRSDAATRRSPRARSGANRTFYLMLVRALLHALESQSAGRAAFVTQLRSSWPIAAEAN